MKTVRDVLETAQRKRQNIDRWPEVCRLLEDNIIPFQNHLHTWSKVVGGLRSEYRTHTCQMILDIFRDLDAPLPPRNVSEEPAPGIPYITEVLSEEEYEAVQKMRSQPIGNGVVMGVLMDSIVKRRHRHL